ncbi:MAG: hypothetical protein COU22_00230 [Candidatus Komeilibacteria bacterium CG10_big_fil_rev_8_21_14_0_10_41_13]|uniref:Glycosyl transferase family 1 domain-containing protein n=1 Tax=Candidatus Komeilibacteria bacterium CG10_big_fil_rev_8_21_14_0_10_41_13 TaxID=1974476 RepID=A0A2M6WDF0_9BACT|nr:MAG: hypothetical protein COU22_00230 [Candidatus Komeilibacteria bacterium CG10_big_fil_rev_8_21_14_0_10_41_13]
MTTAVIQALATGLPAITTDHSGFPDQIIEGKNGFMVKEGDWQALAEKILSYMDNPQLWPGFSSFGRSHMEKTYDVDILIERQIEIYQDLINQDL